MTVSVLHKPDHSGVRLGGTVTSMLFSHILFEEKSIFSEKLTVKPSDTGELSKSEALCWEILILKPTQNVYSEPSPAAHIHFFSLQPIHKVSQPYEAAAGPALTPQPGLWPVSTALLLIARSTGRCHAHTGPFFPAARCRGNITLQLQPLRYSQLCGMKTHLSRDRELFTSSSISPPLPLQSCLRPSPRRNFSMQHVSGLYICQHHTQLIDY